MGYGLIGKKLEHSYSPQIHTMLAEYEYKLFPMEETAVEAFLQKGEFDGLNVTIPYKNTVIKYLDGISDTARRLDSVNTVIRKKDGTLYGENTDYFGLKAMLLRGGFDLQGKKTVILGSGGTGRTAQCVCEDMGARESVIISRNGENNYTNLYLHADADYVINTTPVGMYPNNGEAPVNLSAFPQCKGVADVIYNPSRTALLIQAEKKGIRCVNGLYMLVAQAARASELFTGKAVEEARIEAVCRQIERQSVNIVLVGMPGSGKSSVGKELARILDRPFIDTDEMIEREEKFSIPEIFAKKGELYFRDAESRIIAQTGKLSSHVIATGGGAVLREENVDAMRQNGTVIFLEREIDELSRDGRPLSINADLNEMHERRLPYYQRAAHLSITVEETVEETALKAVKLLKGEGL